MSSSIHEAMLKWYILIAGQLPPPGLRRQLLEPWTWETVPFGSVHNQLLEPWTWGGVEPPSLRQQVSEPWSS